MYSLPITDCSTIFDYLSTPVLKCTIYSVHCIVYLFVWLSSPSRAKVYTVHCTVYLSLTIALFVWLTISPQYLSVQCTVYLSLTVALFVWLIISLRAKVYTAHCTVYLLLTVALFVWLTISPQYLSVQCSVYSVVYSLPTTDCSTVFLTQHLLPVLKCTVYSVQCTVYSV